ncbi:hypothetical protein MKX03_029865 [Papaver bracteatum]|nr:hypothetical protein MKX03_029865 [Papaver bracteatum]
MAGSRSCRIALIRILIGLLYASDIFVCHAKVQFNCSYTDTTILINEGVPPTVMELRRLKLIASGYKLLQYMTYTRDHTISAAIQGKCYDLTDCDRICSQLANTRADKFTGKKGNCATDGVTKESLCTCCVP